MNLQAEKLEVLKLILDTDDKNIISEVKSIFKKSKKAPNKDAGLNSFYDGFKDGVHEVKLSLEGKAELKDAKAWLNEIQD
jgi:hypothetical protein